MKKTLYLLRHCATIDSEKGINGSRTNTPLSENGLDQAKNLIPQLSSHTYQLIVLSPLQRTKQTVQPYFDSLMVKPEILIESLTTERDLGVLTKSISAEGKVSASIQASGKSKTEWVPPQGESIIEVNTRAKQFMIFLEGRKETSILICGHQIFLRCIELIINNKPLNDRNFYSDIPLLMKLGELREYSVQF